MFHYYAPPCAPSGGGAPDSPHVAPVPAGLADVDALLRAAGAALAFPAYYGANFDAFWDCLRTLDAIAAKRVLLVHEDLPALPRDALATYAEILRDAVLYWRRRPDEHVFEAWFPDSAKRRLGRVLEGLPPPCAED